MDEVLAQAAGADGPVHERLARAALETLGRLAAEPSRRATALHLLAVDALLTYACEAAAEAGPSALAGLTASLDWSRFEGIAEEAGA